MAVLVDKNTRLIVQGITGKEGTFHMLQMRDYSPHSSTHDKAAELASLTPAPEDLVSAEAKLWES